MSPALHRTLVRLVIAAVIAIVVRGKAEARDDDPCLETLTGEEDLERYDALVQAYLDAADRDPAQQVEALDDLIALCDRNLRLYALRGRAHLELDHCAEALADFETVERRARLWPDKDHASTAMPRARGGLEHLRRTCVAEVSVECAGEPVYVSIGGQPAEPCPLQRRIVAGNHLVVVRDGASIVHSQPHDLSPGVHALQAGRTGLRLLDEPVDVARWVWGGVTLGGGVALVVTGAALLASAADERAMLEADADGLVRGISQKEAEEIRDRADALDIGGGVALGLGGVAVLSGALMLALWPESTSPALALIDGGGLLTLATRF